MIDFIQLQKIIKDQLDQDRLVKTIDVSAITLEMAINEASTLLDMPQRKLEYEIVQQGSSGFLGMGKKEWKIRAYPRLVLKKDTAESILANTVALEQEKVIQDKDGGAFVHKTLDGVMLKVTAPQGNGKRVTDYQALHALKIRDAVSFDEKIVHAIVEDAEGQYIKVGTFDHKYSEDSMINVEISADEMKAFIIVTPPGPRGCDLSLETIISFLKNNKVVMGIKEEALRDFIDTPVYRQPVVAAEGIEPKNGESAYMEYYFRTDQSKIQLRESNSGNIDFKELNIIQNVVENQILAKKIHATEGITGRTVTGKFTHSKNGVDIELPLGKNVQAASDGDTVLAAINGQVVLVNGKVNVEPVFTVQGNVNLKTGNITFLGTVVVTGNVEDSFSVKATGNIEVNGTVERAELEAEGDIIVHQGITGKGTGTVRAGKSIWARFIENAIIDAGNTVIVSDGIVNSKVDANKRIICHGKRAHIVGGHLRASEEISALNIGSLSTGTETLCEVGIDPKKKEQLDTLLEHKGAIEKELEDIQLNIQTLINIQKQRKKLPEDKEQYMRSLGERRFTLSEDLQKTNEEIIELQEFLANITVNGKVSAGNKIFPGVKIVIKDIVENVRTEYKSTSFTLENGLIRSGKYEEPDKDSIKGPEGYIE
ncbi:MAG: FapA family protein [Spirochaetaceae bacterium]|jgi:uncharacterized protein (DUF342 family)|nr:FapA family protein [Spirochaetaceae bacterium]